MPNFVLTYNSPVAHVYERKINLGYTVPDDQTQKERNMNEHVKDLELADAVPADAVFYQDDADYPLDEPRREAVRGNDIALEVLDEREDSDRELEGDDEAEVKED